MDVDFADELGLGEYVCGPMFGICVPLYDVMTAWLFSNVGVGFVFRYFRSEMILTSEPVYNLNFIERFPTRSFFMIPYWFGLVITSDYQANKHLVCIACSFIVRHVMIFRLLWLVSAYTDKMSSFPHLLHAFPQARQARDACTVSQLPHCFAELFGFIGIWEVFFCWCLHLALQ